MSKLNGSGQTRAAVIYAAKSTEDKHGSIPTQLADCRAMAEREGWTVVGEYTDEAFSAYHGDRGPGLAAARDHVERLRAEERETVLLVQHSDRLARGDGRQAKHLVAYALWALEQGVTIRSVQDPGTFDLEHDYGLLMTTVGGIRNTEDSRRKSKSITDGLRRAAERGKYAGSRPYGFCRRDRTEDGRETGPLVVDEAEAAVVRRVFADYLAGRAQTAIARDLEREGVPTLSGGMWFPATIRGMLTNPIYIGRVTLHGEHFQGRHPAIVDAATWQEAQGLRAARNAHGRPRGRRTVGRHLLTEGMLRCSCGSAMSPVTKSGARNRGGYEVYRCIKRQFHGADACDERALRRVDVDTAIFDYFENVAVDVDSTRAVITDQATRDLAQNSSLRAHAVREAAKAEASLARVERDYLDGKLSVEKWERFEATLTDELAGAKAQVEQYDRRREAIEAQIGMIDTEAAVAQELASLRRQIAGEVAGSDDLDQVRTLLGRLFVGFELASPKARLGSGALRGGATWVGADDRKNPLSLDDGYFLIPVLRLDGIDLERDDPAGFPAVRRLPVGPSVFLGASKVRR
jgi:DNA invertase Pin-like site-specific DNA recombinase